MTHYDSHETRSAAARAEALALSAQVARAQALPGNGVLAGVDAGLVQMVGDLEELAVLRKRNLPRIRWRMRWFLHACGIGRGDIVQNCFSYHLTPAGMIVESGARAMGATVLPVGTGQSEWQVRAAHDLGVTCSAGTPDTLKVLLEGADAAGLALSITRAAVSGGLFPSLRQFYAERGIACLRCYATGDLGMIAYESSAMGE